MRSGGLKPCLMERENGRIVSMRISAMMASEAKALKKVGWLFDWTKPYREALNVYKLTLVDGKQIQGAIALTEDEANQAVYVGLVEVAPHNYGHNGQFKGTGGLLFAFAAKRSVELGFHCVFFDAKTALIEYYQKTLGAKTLGYSQRMSIEGESLDALIARYYKEAGNHG